MLLYKNGRFYGEKVSFLVPDGFYLEVDPEIIGEYGFCAWSPQRDCLCCWRSYDGCGGTAAELETRFFPECGCVPLSPVTPIQLNGLSGHFVFYRDLQKQYYEARFDLTDGDQLSFSVEAQGKDIRRLMDTPECKAVLTGIQAQ